jgi:prepilin-type N-terminal cleavage/methylation domain-containing protein/prepilin-type processing-associated H-X9-DG protein
MGCIRAERSRRAGFTLVELLVVIAIIGILVALLLPAVQSAREAARRSQCQNNAKQIALALQNYASANRSLPPGTMMNPYGDPEVPAFGVGWGWGTFILPYMEEVAAYDSMNFKSTVGDPSATLGGAQLIVSFICPSAPNETDYWAECCSGYDHGGNPNYDFRLTNYAGVSDAFDGFFLSSQPVARGDGVLFNFYQVPIQKITDGSSHTLMVGEVTGGWGVHPSSGRAWISHMWITWNCQDTADGINGFGSVPGGRSDALDPFDGDGDCPGRHCEYFNESGFSSFHPGGAHFAYADGSVHFLEETIDQNLLGVLTTRNGGETPGEAPYRPRVGPPQR